MKQADGHMKSSCGLGADKSQYTIISSTLSFDQKTFQQNVAYLSVSWNLSELSIVSLVWQVVQIVILHLNFL